MTSVIFGLAFIGFTAIAIWQVYSKLRFGILELLTTLVGATIPIFLISRQYRSLTAQLNVEDFVSFIVVLCGGIICTLVGSGLAMRWVDGLDLHHSLWRLPLLVFGWFLVPAGMVQIAALVMLPFIIFNRQHELIPFCLCSSATLLIWIAVAILNRRVRSRWDKVDRSIDIWTRD